MRYRLFIIAGVLIGAIAPASAGKLSPASVEQAIEIVAVSFGCQAPPIKFTPEGSTLEQRVPSARYEGDGRTFSL
jgi:hypothetical protein